MESTAPKSYSKNGRSSDLHGIADEHQLVDRYAANDSVKSTPLVPSSEQPVVSLEPTTDVKSALITQPYNTTQAVAATQTIDASVSIAVPVATPKRRSFRPRVKPLRLPSEVHTFHSFAYRNYRYIWGASFFFSGAFWLQTVIVGWLTFSLTQSALLTSIAMGLDALPILLVGPIGGVLVDAFDRRKLLALNYIYQAIITLSFSAIIFLGLLESWHIFAFIFLMGLSWVINDPARMSLMSTSVPKEYLVNAFALNGLAFSSTRLIIPAFGGVVLAFAGPGPALLIQVTLQIAAALSALSIQLPVMQRAKLRFRSTFRDILDGARYVKSQPIVLGLMLFSTLPPILIMPFAHGLIPVYAGEVFKVGPATLGLWMSALGAGSLVGTILLASFEKFWPKGKGIVASMLITAASMVLFALNSSVSMAYPLIMLMSVGVITFFATAGATIQGIVPDEFRGRVTGLYIVTFGMMPLGSVVAGILADYIGAPNTTLIGSGLILLGLAVLMLRFPEVWRLK